MIKQNGAAQRPFAVFDIDGTVARTSLYLATVHAMKRRGMLPDADAKAIDEALDAWLGRSSDQSFEDYAKLCIEVFDRALPTIKFSAYQAVVDEVMERFSHKIYRYTTELIKELKKRNYMIFAISGSEQSIVERFCAKYGFDDCIGNTYEHDNLYFTGKTGTTFKNKVSYVEQLVSKHDCTLKGSIAIGDTHGDIEMLEYADQAIAFNPNKTLFDYAKKAGWKIVIERKNVTYELEPENGKYLLA